MLALERENEIMSIINEQRSATVTMLSRELFVSEATIRRDLIKMELMGLIKRSHGGAMLPSSSFDEPPQALRETKNIQKKRVIAGLAVKFINNNSCIFMDSSSTAGAIIPLLFKFGYLTVITNGLKNALNLAENTKAKVYVSSGAVQTQSSMILGSDTVEYISRLHADIAILSCYGIDCNQGITEAGIEQANTKLAMIENADQVILLADSTKFGRKYMAKSCSFNKINYLITDEMPSDEYVKMIEKQGCKIIVPDTIIDF